MFTQSKAGCPFRRPAQLGHKQMRGRAGASAERRNHINAIGTGTPTIPSSLKLNKKSQVIYLLPSKAINTNRFTLLFFSHSALWHISLTIKVRLLWFTVLNWNVKKERDYGVIGRNMVRIMTLGFPLSRPLWRRNRAASIAAQRLSQVNGFHSQRKTTGRPYRTRRRQTEQ